MTWTDVKKPYEGIREIYFMAVLEGSGQAYVSKHRRSQGLFQEALSLFPGGVSHNNRTLGLAESGLFPFFIDHAKGPYLYDVDGNKITDYWCGHYALILGHAPEQVIKAIREQLPKGTMWGLVHEKSIELGSLVKKHVKCAEMMRFTNSGTEATMYAVRLARGYTRKRMIIKMMGAWHGGNPVLQVSVHPPFDVPDSLGYLSDEFRWVKAIPFNESQTAIEALKKHKDDLAGVIVEPVLGGIGKIPAKKEFLNTLREETNRYGAPLIYDEVITGFRLGIGGGQAHYGVIPDIATMGKVAGGGMPLSIICGRKEIMEAADPIKHQKKEELVWIGGGTYSCNPLSMVAGAATIRTLESHPEIYRRIASHGERIRNGVNEIGENLKGYTIQANGIASLFSIKLTKNGGKGSQGIEDKVRAKEFLVRIIDEGLYIPRGGAAISAAHSKEDIENTLAIIERTARKLQ
jgi:glutamate-1-semialdehyde 2,1-aminomutase